jgi:hypothetical protein
MAHPTLTRARRRPLLLAVAALLAAACLLWAAPRSSAAGVPTHGHTWRSGSTLKVFSKLPKRYDRSIAAAIRQYNTAGARVRLKRVRRARGANVVMRLARIRPSGLSTQGKPRGGRSQVKIARGFDVAARGDGPYFAAFLVTHELGHVLGLDHPVRNRRMCTVMNPGFFDVCKRPQQEAGTWVCGLLQRTDLKALARLYGGHARKRGSWYCKLPASTPKPVAREVRDASVEVLPGNVDLAARVHWAPEAGLRMLVERRDVPCAQAAGADVPVKAMNDSDADNTVDAAAGVAEDPFTVEAPTTVCYSLTLVDPKTDGRSATVHVEAQLAPAG